MAQKQTVTYESDLSGAAITDNEAPTLSFGWDGTDYEIDLTSAEAEKFYKAVEKYINAGRKVPKTRSGRKTIKSAQSGPTPAEIRAWAQQNGHEVPSRGRIPQEVRDAYDADN